MSSAMAEIILIDPLIAKRIEEIIAKMILKSILPSYDQQLFGFDLSKEISNEIVPLMQKELEKSNGYEQSPPPSQEEAQAKSWWQFWKRS
jgi:hypothetical protein